MSAKKVDNAKCETSDSIKKKSAIFTRNAVVTKFLELCIQPQTDKEMENVLLKFWKRFDSLLGSSDFSEIDVIVMFVLDYAYKEQNISLSSMSRCLFAYQRHIQVKFFENPSLNPSIKCFLNELRDFTNVYSYSRCEEMLIDIGLGSVLDASLGLSLYLMKFGLMEFPADDNSKGRKMVQMLVFGFNNFMDKAGRKAFIKFDEMLHRMRQSDIRFRRCLLMLCVAVIAAEYEMHEKMESWFKIAWATEKMKQVCIRKLECLNMVVSTTTETKITYRDIEKFIARVLSSLLHETVCRCLVEMSRKLFNDVREYHNPRSLKDLARCRIRAGFQKRRMYTEQVNELSAPDAIKEEILFQREGIWDLLKENHLSHKLSEEVNKNVFIQVNVEYRN